MSQQELITVAVIGGVFVILGIIVFLWSRKEEGSWYSFVSKRVDVREFVDRGSGHTEHAALRTGGKICIALGIVILLIALGFLIWS